MNILLIGSKGKLGKKLLNELKLDNDGHNVSEFLGDATLYQEISDQA
jgi:dTDP-4-dehydrorhamnose reductase